MKKYILTTPGNQEESLGNAKFGMRNGERKNSATWKIPPSFGDALLSIPHPVFDQVVP
jgi:hypothetical protein